MNLITKKVNLPKVGNVKITFYRDRKRSTKDKTTFSMPFDVQMGDGTYLGEIIYNTVFRSCKILWTEPPEDRKAAEETETFIKEFLFGTLMSLIEPISENEIENIMDRFFNYQRESLKYRITENGICEITTTIASTQTKQIKFQLKKKDTGDFIITDEGIVLRQFRPHEKGQRDRVVFVAKKLGLEIKEEEITLESNYENLSDALYKYIQIISAVYLFYLS